MKDLYLKSMNTLELPRVLDMLASCAVSQEAKERAVSLTPVSDIDEVRKSQNETTAACRLMSLHSSPDFSGVKNVGPALGRANMGGVLNNRELLDIAALLRAARRVKAYVGDSEHTCIHHLFHMLQANRYLEDKIGNAIEDENEVADAASPELGSIRRHIRNANAKVRSALQKIITSPHFSKYLQEPIITLRSNRYVVPVKSECKNDVPGLIHDVSSSGATFYVEPMQVVQANNELKELLEKEKNEIERILAELSADVAAHNESIHSDYDILVSLDLIFAKGRLSYQMKAAPPDVRQDNSLNFKRARHPLLNSSAAVPISVSLGVDYDTLVITGPNTGGKTVTMKTIGLLTLMAQCGLHIPADDGSHVSVFERVLADIGDEQSIEQSLSTFSSHMKNIVSILECAAPGSLILFDELGAGTDPVEGAALAIAVIEYSRNIGARVAATTHYAELKVFAMNTEGVQNASCEFDVETLKPTYRLLIGVPGKSNAFAISSRLGLSRHIVDNAKKLVDSDSTDFEEVLNQLEKQRQAMEAARIETERLKRQTEENEKISEQLKRELEREREKAVERARAEARKIIEDARDTANAVFTELNQMKSRATDSVRETNDARAELGRRLNEAESALGPREKTPEPPPPSRELKVGDIVQLSGIGTKATVLSIDKESLQLQAGIMKISAKKNEVRLLENETQPEVKRFIAKSQERLRNLSASPELDLRGMLPENATDVLDIFLDNARMANLNSVTIIHGKGTGVLRKAVTQHLKNRSGVKSFRLGLYGEGESGVTIVEL